MSKDITTLSRLFLNTCRNFPKPELLKAKVDGRWRAVSTEEFERRVRRLSLGLRALGLKPGDKAAILAESGPDWVIADFAILCAGGRHGRRSFPPSPPSRSATSSTIPRLPLSSWPRAASCGRKLAAIRAPARPL